MSRFLKVREGYFALLIPSKWEFRDEYVQTIMCLLHIYIDLKQVSVFLESASRVYEFI